ncbi:MAG TPA: hypothetical protein VKV04_07465 [Verrucomicrobiae bacterium]|nr:hypothetical protein [Verrucomicrobiae bacterium]
MNAMSLRLQKRAYRKRPGLSEAAKQLGCTYQHLRLCVIGARSSKSLLKKYHALQRRAAETKTTPEEFAARQQSAATAPKKANQTREEHETITNHR